MDLSKRHVIEMPDGTLRCKKSSLLTKEFMNWERVFPPAQFPVQEAIASLEVFPEITRIIVFGSALEERYGPWSDIDLFVEGLPRSEIWMKGLTTRRSFDILTPDMLSEEEPILQEIKKRGVVVFERDAV